LGYASSSESITGYGTISSVFPSSGSIYGGQMVTISGNGFSDKTTVSFGSSMCKIIEYSINQLKCVSSEHSEGSTNLIIKYGLFALFYQNLDKKMTQI